MKALGDALERVFGDGHSDAQAELFNALGVALWNSCRRADSAFESQCCYLESDLDEHGRRLARVLGGFVEGGS